MRIAVSSAVTAAVLAALLSACGTDAGTTDQPSTAPAPVRVAGLSTLASPVQVQGAPQLALHTEAGDITFWGGVNVGTTIPAHNPGELAIPREMFREWFPQMTAMGVRFLRVYTIMTPAFYEELVDYNNSHADAPLYLVQGVYLPDESYAVEGSLLDEPADSAFTQELADASAAVHGDLSREPLPGRASGTWTADVSPWVAGWIIGSELDPHGVLRGDEAYADIPEFEGTYFSSKADLTVTTPTERWLARHMDELATAEAARGTSAPIAFVNWPTADPLAHPTEPNPNEDLVTIDANHIVASDAWPGGSFASYHVYPYYPDFMRFEPELQQKLPGGTRDAYASYLRKIRAHHAEAGLPTLVTEFGVPSSIGAAHYGTNGRNQGAHTEQDAMAMDAQMMRSIKAQGLGGAFLFIWADEWFKFTWNTYPRTTVAHSERRSLWHDPLTNEQWFGVYAMDPAPYQWSTPYESKGSPVTAFSHAIDASYVYLELKLTAPDYKRIVFGFDMLEGGQPLPGRNDGSKANDVAVVIDNVAHTATAYVRSEVDPVKLDGLLPESLLAPDLPGWNLQRLTANRAVPATGGLPARPAEYFETGRLIQGVWDPSSDEYNSLATWWMEDGLIELRIPWSMLLMGDPSSKTAVQPVNGTAVASPVTTIHTVLQVDTVDMAVPGIRWEAWNRVEGQLRLKRGADALTRAWKSVNAL